MTDECFCKSAGPRTFPTIVQDADAAVEAEGLDVSGVEVDLAAGAPLGRPISGIEAVVVGQGATVVHAGTQSDRPIWGAEQVRCNQNSGLGIIVHRPGSGTGALAPNKQAAAADSPYLLSSSP